MIDKANAWAHRFGALWLVLRPWAHGLGAWSIGADWRMVDRFGLIGPMLGLGSIVRPWADCAALAWPWVRHGARCMANGFGLGKAYHSADNPQKT